MAKQQKKSQARKPHAAEPRMYGDGQPSQQAGGQPTGAQPHASASAAPAAAPAAAPRTASRTAGAAPRGAGASGAYARADRITDYSYVIADLRRLGITAAAIMGVLVVLSFIV